MFMTKTSYGAFNAGIVVLMFLTSLAALPYLPDQMPMHWNFAGEVDRYGSKYTSALLTPLLGIAMLFLFPLFRKIDPRSTNYEKFESTYNVLQSAILAFFFLIHLAIIGAGLGYEVSVPRLIQLSLGLLFLVIGNVMPRIKPNYFTGIKTPWTLADETVWARTHRFAGWSFVLGGISMILFSLIYPLINVTAGIVIFIMIVFSVSLLPVFYSWLIYQIVSQK